MYIQQQPLWVGTRASPLAPSTTNSRGSTGRPQLREAASHVEPTRILHHVPFAGHDLLRPKHSGSSILTCLPTAGSCSAVLLAGQLKPAADIVSVTEGAWLHIRPCQCCLLGPVSMGCMQHSYNCTCTAVEQPKPLTVHAPCLQW